MNKYGVLLSICLLVAVTPVQSAEKASSAADDNTNKSAISLSSLAARADLVAVVQVKDTDYVYTRSFPSGGSAFLKILIPYKLSKAGEDIIEIFEKGLHPNECYFENPSVFEEGRRYLVFLRLDAEDPGIYRGLDEGCALEILVAADNRYVLKYPADGIDLADNLDELAREYSFHDNYALVSGESLAPGRRDDLLSRGLIIPRQGKFRFTHGVELATVRKLMGIEARSISSPNGHIQDTTL